MATLGHGARITQQEYERRIVELHSGLPPAPDKNQRRDVRKKELDFAIDFRLGRDFPAERRQALWQIQQGIEKRRVRLMIGYLLRKAFGKSLHTMAKGLAGFVVDEYSKVLSAPELEHWFGKDIVDNPSLPVDFD